MRKTAATIIILGVLWIGYTAWPIYDLVVLVRAIETRDLATVTRHVYFDAVRISLTNQVVDAYLRRTGTEIGPLRRNIAAAAIANPVVEKLISPEALSELLSAGWPVTVIPDAPPGTVGITETLRRDHLADFCKLGIWDWQIRSVSAGLIAAAAALPSHVSALAVALATRRGHPPGDHSKLTRR